jgi:integrase
VPCAGYLGLRWGELVGLQTKDVLLPAGRLTVTHTLVEVNGHLHESRPKTAKGIRSMTIPRYVGQALGEHVGRFAGTDGRVFTSAEGGPIRKTFGRRHFAPAAARAGLLPLRFHDLRHTAASLMILTGAHPKVVQERLGHSSITVTFDTYGHLFPDLDDTVAVRLDELATKASAASPPPHRTSVTRLTRN